MTYYRWGALSSLFSVLALAFCATGASAAANCPARKDTLAKNSYGRIWHASKSLYACTTVYGHKPRARRLGPWLSGGRAAFDGVNVAWTVPLTRDGVRSDRAWAGNADNGKRWLLGSRLVPAAAGNPQQEARIQSILVADQSVAWVTTAGDVVLALHEPEDSPVAIGTLPGALVPDHNLVLLGNWATPDAKTLAATAKLEELDGDGDECGGSNPYRLTVQPDPAGPRLGATWTGSWESTNCS